MSAKNVLLHIPYYPDQKDPDFMEQISRKKEFYDYKLERSEPVPETAGDLLQTQEFMRRFFSPHTPYKEALLFHGLGTGKTCTSAAIIENFKNTSVGDKKRPPALVFVKNDVLKFSYEREISSVCTKDVYAARQTALQLKKGTKMTEKEEVRRLNVNIAKTYEIVTFEAFLNNLSSDSEFIKRQYSNRIIIVDEAHSFRIQTHSSDDEDAVEEKNYGKLHRFLHTVEGCRILLLTGTPIWDRSNEFGSLMNLILPLDNQLPTGRKFDDMFFNGDVLINKKKLARAIKGRVSYLRQMMTTARREEVGTKDPWLKYITIYPVQMSDQQAFAANEALTKLVKIEKKGKIIEIAGGVVSRDARSAANMVIPIFDAGGNIIDYDYGTKALEKYGTAKLKVLGEKDKYIKTHRIDNRFLRDALLKNLQEFSAKFAAIISEIKAHPNEVTFIYNETVTGSGGSIMLALCMEIHGFTKVDRASHIEQKSDNRRFAIITSDEWTTHSPKKVKELLDRANQPDNRYGEHLQVIIGSEKIALGITIKNVRRVYIVMPHWNMPAIEQAQARGFRFGSHDALPENERWIKIYKMAAVEAGDEAVGTGYPKKAGFSSEETIDIKIYRRAEEKEYKNTQIFRLIKENAFDCALFYNRNVLKEDVDNSRECDYQNCKYHCDANALEEKIDSLTLDYSTYNLFYADKELQKMIENIIELFSSYFSLYIDTAKDLLEIKEQDESLFLRALTTIIDSRVEIHNRYGFRSYLKESNNILFLDVSITSKSSYPENTYVENPLIVENTSMNDLVTIMELKKDKEIVEEFCESPSEEIYNKLSHKGKIILVESVFSSTSKSPAAIIIREIAEPDVYTMKDGSYVHILYADEFLGASYDVAAKTVKATGLMRFFDTNDEKWKFIDDPDKELKYVGEIKNILSSQKGEEFKDNPYGVYGTISKKDQAFRIHIKLDSGKSRGRKCTTWGIADLIDIFISKIKFLPKSKKEYEKLDKEELMQRINNKSKKYSKTLENKSESDLRKILTLFNMDSTELCDSLYSWFKKQKLLFYI